MLEVLVTVSSRQMLLYVLSCNQVGAAVCGDAFRACQSPVTRHTDQLRVELL